MNKLDPQTNSSQIKEEFRVSSGLHCLEAVEFSYTKDFCLSFYSHMNFVRGLGGKDCKKGKNMTFISTELR